MSFRRAIRSNVVFCLGLATAMLATRFAAHDAEVIFKLRYIPNHDMAAATGFFTTNVHAVRTTGDIAWWNPVSYAGHGYPQYFQSFLSPLAPTCGHIVLIVWMQIVRASAAVGIRMPEYMQYLVVTYGVLPFLTFFSFSVFASQIFRRRSTVALVATAYAVSGIGLWNAAWFYFQESFTLYLFLAATLAVLRRPTFARALVLLAAILVQAASINYWTIYNSWFVLIFLSCYAWAYRTRVVRAYVRFREWLLQHRLAAAGLAGLMLAVIGPWLAIIASIAHEQGSTFVRPHLLWSYANEANAAAPPHGYSPDFAYTRVPETRWITGGLFNPKVDRVLDKTPIRIPMHDARYIGIAFLPLLVLLPLTDWQRRERWLAATAAGVLCVCIAPPLLLAAWKATPGMDRVLHLFSFYTQFWQLLLVLLGGAVFDRLVGVPTAAAWRRATPVLVSMATVAGLTLVVIGLTSERYAVGNEIIERITRAGLLLTVGCGLLLQLRFAPHSGPRIVYAWIFVIVAAADLSRYSYEVNQADLVFTRQFRENVPYPLPPEVVARLRHPWPAVDPSAGFAGALPANLPIVTEFWPENQFLIPRHIWDVLHSPAGGGILTSAPAPVLFYRSAETVATDATLPTDVDGDPDRFYHSLVLHGGPALAPNAEASDSHPSTVPHQFRRWSYNDFGLSVDAPAQGWLLLHQTYDPLWHISIDGQPTAMMRANQFRMAVAIPPGRHTVEMSYRPFARSIYWPACWMLETALAILSIGAWRASRAKSRLRLSDFSTRKIAA